MILLALFKDALSIFGLFWLCSVVWKIARKYPARRWFV